MNHIVKESLIRSYYFAEALALYERYDRPLVEIYAPATKELVDSERFEDRPLTWVALVFHCTTADRVPHIIEEGEIRPGESGSISHSELSIGELDRMKSRHH